MQIRTRANSLNLIASSLSLLKVAGMQGIVGEKNVERASTCREGTRKIVLASWAPFLAGAEVAAERLALGLLEAGHRVLVVLGTNGAALERFRHAGLRCEYVGMHLTDKWVWWRHARAQREFAKLLRSERPDVVHFNDLPTSQMLGRVAGRLGVPRLCHHRFIFDGIALDWLNKYGADRHVFVSRALMDELSANSEKLRASPRAVVYDGLPLPAIPSVTDRRTARDELRLPQDKQIVLFAGQIIERKGVADLLHAWSIVTQRGQSNAELYIVGDDLAGKGAYRCEMQQLAGKLSCPVRFMGFQKYVERWLTACDVVMVPSHVEPLGNATLEAMAHARPVIGGDVGGIPEMVVHDETGLLVPPKSPPQLAAAIVRLLQNREAAVQFGAAARRRCEAMFSLEAHTQSVLAEYDAVLSTAGALSRS